MEKEKLKLAANGYAPEGGLIGTKLNSLYLSSLGMLESAAGKNLTLEAVATLCDCSDMSLRIDFGFAEGIIPKEEVLCANEVKDIAVLTRVGKPVCFKIKDFIYGEDGKIKVILSRKDAQRECAKNLIELLSPGDIIPCTVTHLDTFGAFVDIGCGIVSLICVDCISVSRIFHPSDRLSVGDRIYAAVKSVDRDSGRIYMTLRELLGTWEENAEKFAPCSTVPGIVRSIEDYGIFVELTPNLAGLAEIRDGVAVGDLCTVYIKSIIPEKMKVKLVIIDSRPGSPFSPPVYRMDAANIKHIDYWRYSPANCTKVIETKFDAM